MRGLCKKLHWNWSYFSTSVDQLIYQIHLLNFFQQCKPRVLDKGRRVPLRLVFCVDHSFWGQVGWREREMERDWIGKRKIIWLNSRWSVEYLPSICGQLQFRYYWIEDTHQHNLCHTIKSCQESVLSYNYYYLLKANMDPTILINWREDPTTIFYPFPLPVVNNSFSFLSQFAIQWISKVQPTWLVIVTLC